MKAETEKGRLCGKVVIIPEAEENYEDQKVNLFNLGDPRIKSFVVEDFGQEIFRMTQADDWILVLKRDPGASRLYYFMRFKNENRSETNRQYLCSGLKWLAEPLPGHFPKDILKIPIFSHKL